MHFPWFQELFESPELRKIILEKEDLRKYLGTINVNSLKLYPRKQIVTRNRIVNEIYKYIQK